MRASTKDYNERAQAMTKDAEEAEKAKGGAEE